MGNRCRARECEATDAELEEALDATDFDFAAAVATGCFAVFVREDDCSRPAKDR